MQIYTNFIGIDVAKQEFVVAVHDTKNTKIFSNSASGIKKFIKSYKKILPQALVVLETTGGYEWTLLSTLVDQNFNVHRADTYKVKNFIRSLRKYGKTDNIDATGLAIYAYERSSQLKPFDLPDRMQQKLSSLLKRRSEFVSMRTEEKNREKAPLSFFAAPSFKDHIEYLNEKINLLDIQIREIISANKDLKEKKKVAMTIPGVGEKTAETLVGLVPELGQVSRREIASLAGVAPHPYDSGKGVGYRRMRGGRPDVKKILFMAAMAAAHSKSWLGDFYRRLVDEGKCKMVALGALMRKIIVIANARIGEYMLNVIDAQTG